MFKLFKNKKEKIRLSAERNFRISKLLDHIIKTKLGFGTEYEAVICDSYEEYEAFCKSHFDFISIPNKNSYPNGRWYYDSSRKVSLYGNDRNIYFVPVFKKNHTIGKKFRAYYIANKIKQN